MTRKTADPDSLIIERLYEGALDGDVWRAALLSITRAVGGTGTLLLTYDVDSGALLRDETVGIDPGNIACYREHWAPQDIRVPAGANHPLFMPVTEEMILPRHAWERSTIFNEALRYLDISYMIGAWLQRSGNHLTSISIQGTADRGPFDSDALDRVRPLIPHVRRALSIRERFERQELQASALRSAFDHAACGVMVLDDRGHVLCASDSVIRDLMSTGSIKRRLCSSCELVGPLARRIRELEAASRSNGARVGGVVELPRPKRRPLSVALAPLPQTNSFWLSAPPRWVALVTDPDRTMQASIPVIMQHLHISEREAEITAALCAGDTLAQVAIRFGISPHTARSHLKSVYLKTGIHSKTELVRRVVSGPATASAFNGRGVAEG